MGVIMEGAKQEEKRPRLYQAIDFSADEGKRLLRQPVQRIREIVKDHDAWQLESSNSNAKI